MSLASERTFLAYTRTGLALVAAGVAVSAVWPGNDHTLLRRVVGVGLVVLGTVVSLYARRRWHHVDQAMRRGDPLPPSRLALLVTVTMGLVGVLAVVLVLLG